MSNGLWQCEKSIYKKKFAFNRKLFLIKGVERVNLFFVAFFMDFVPFF
mgnify:CR=1 FL=1